MPTELVQQTVLRVLRQTACICTEAVNWEPGNCDYIDQARGHDLIMTGVLAMSS